MDKSFPREAIPEAIRDRMLLIGYRGSIAHGTYVPPDEPNSTDDKDVMGIFVAPKSHYLGTERVKETVEYWHNEWDCVYYELKKFILLLQKGNPNVLSLLWMDPDMYLMRHPITQHLMTHRSIFLSKQLYPSFYGYAKQQFKKMSAKQQYQGYMGKKRKALVEKYGYDTKNCSHMIRLLRMGIEVFSQGKVIVKRPDAQDLIELKQGKRTLAQAQEEGGRLMQKLREAKEQSHLPHEPDYRAINHLCMTLLEESLREQD